MLERKGRLIVPLPLLQADYMQDFTTDASKSEFLALLQKAEQVITLPPAGSREAAYEAAGAFCLIIAAF